MVVDSALVHVPVPKENLCYMPPEILEGIFEIFSDALDGLYSATIACQNRLTAISSLTSLASTCRFLLPFARRHLVRKVTIGSFEKAEKVLEHIEKYDCMHMVKQLSLSAFSEGSAEQNMKAVEMLLRRLTSLKSIFLNALFAFGDHVDISRLFRLLADYQPQNPFVLSIFLPLDLMNEFPPLEPESIEALLSLSNLERFAIFSVKRQDYFDRLQSLDLKPKFRLRKLMIGDKMIKSRLAPVLLESCRDSLNNLALVTSDSTLYEGLDLSQLTNLKSLDVTFSLHSKSEAPFTDRLALFKTVFKDVKVEVVRIVMNVADWNDFFEILPFLPKTTRFLSIEIMLKPFSVIPSLSPGETEYNRANPSFCKAFSSYLEEHYKKFDFKKELKQLNIPYLRHFNLHVTAGITGFNESSITSNDFPTLIPFTFDDVCKNRNLKFTNFYLLSSPSV